MKRPEVTITDRMAASIKVSAAYEAVISRDKKGPGIFVSSHEALGVIAEEYAELCEAIRSRVESTTCDVGLAPTDHFDDEVVDLAVACLHALASRATGKMQW